MKDTKLLFCIGSAYLPLTIKVKQSLSNPDRFHIEPWIGGGCASGDRVAHDEPTARLIATNMMEQWTSMLKPAFDAGYERGQQRRSA